MDFPHHIACPHCDALNRVPGERLGDSPKCGKCKAALFTGAPIELTDGNFSGQVERTSIPLVVDFWAPWCGPCKAMAPHFARAASQLEPRVRFAKLNTDENPHTAAHFAIRSIPTVVLFRNGREAARQAGAMDAHGLEAWIRSNV
jgi:thioredoxin 2